MFAIVGVAVAVVLIGAVVLMVYTSGNRSKKTDNETRTAATNRNKGTETTTRATGSGDN